ncbi:hypothetical protein XENTR_v10021837 [Xenopus tropicalis]|uniref:Leucine-rich repeat-containing protein DDB_G0290503 isoform X2 n=1 Tax=Xenopus tropicalis TaxID=8364 RepID=A0A8J0R653_XENTR|nr:putative leucine-rich repeat-containing protein DDB_G0290503 isoform X2 [Xenopus tropicalis]KAE8587014.1 hypothetical protein XENTR_v10021837 [Xenopus tropicalis]|eukprot:XP_004917269.1 PREDICTED: putative leucine-rich repeat-containing protein DDB_G0290503 [Xenopus tropicalis]
MDQNRSSELNVSDCTAVSAALVHLLEIEKQLRQEELGFDEEALQYLMGIADALKELEHARRATRELLEEETIRTSKLRYRIQHLPGMITKEIEEAVLSARLLNASELQQLQSELTNKMQKLEHAVRSQSELEEMNLFLSQHGKTLGDAYQQAVDLLNQHMAEKASLNIIVNETHVKCKDAQDAVIEYKNRTEDLAEDMITEREIFFEEKRHLIDEIKETELNTRAQEEQNSKKKEIYVHLTSLLFDEEEKISKEKEIIGGIKDEILLLQASHARLTEKLDVKRQESQNLAQKIYHFETCIEEMKDRYTKESKSLNEKISELGEEMDIVKKLHQTLTEQHKQLMEENQTTREREDKEYAKKQDTAKQLEQIRAALSEKMELYGKLKKEIKILELETQRQVENGRNRTEQLAARVEESKEVLAKETQNRKTLQVKREELSKDLELWKIAEETFTNQLKERIANGKKDIAALTKEVNHLLKTIEQWDNQIHTLTEEIDKAKEAYSDMERGLSAEIDKLQGQLNLLSENLVSETEKLASKINLLKEAEEKHSMAENNYERLKNKVAELKNQQRSLEMSMKRIIKDIETKSELKETKEIALKNLRSGLFEELQSNLGKILLIEKDIYEVNRKLELVTIENCRLKLCCAQFKEDIDKSVMEANTHLSAAQQIQSNLAILIEQLHDEWEKDNFVCKDFSDRDESILDALVQLINKINRRAEKMDFLKGKLQDKFLGLAALLDTKESQPTSVIAH